MNIRNIIIAIASMLSFISCAVIKDPARPDIIPVQKNEFKKLDGKFFKLSAAKEQADQHSKNSEHSSPSPVPKVQERDLG